MQRHVAIHKPRQIACAGFVWRGRVTNPIFRFARYRATQGASGFLAAHRVNHQPDSQSEPRQNASRSHRFTAGCAESPDVSDTFLIERNPNKAVIQFSFPRSCAHRSDDDRSLRRDARDDHSARRDRR